MPRLENWSVGSNSMSPYAAPETCSLHLQGRVYDHPRFDDGTPITTSSISLSGLTTPLTMRTRSGTVYQLGQISEDYCDWYKETHPGKEINKEDPFGYWEHKAKNQPAIEEPVENK